MYISCVNKICIFDEDMENKNINEVVKSLGCPMTRARARRVNGALMQFMNKPTRARDHLKGNEPRLVILIQANEKGVSCGLAGPF